LPPTRLHPRRLPTLGSSGLEIDAVARGPLHHHDTVSESSLLRGRAAYTRKAQTPAPTTSMMSSSQNQVEHVPRADRAVLDYYSNKLVTSTEPAPSMKSLRRCSEPYADKRHKEPAKRTRRDPQHTERLVRNESSVSSTSTPRRRPTLDADSNTTRGQVRALRKRGRSAWALAEAPSPICTIERSQVYVAIVSEKPFAAIKYLIALAAGNGSPSGELATWGQGG